MKTKLKLRNVTLIGVDCKNFKRLALAADISSKEIQFGEIKLLTSLETKDPRAVKIKSISSKKSYSEFLVKELYKYVDTDYALIIQYDGFILNPNAWDDSFLKYDYIGAPWYHFKNLRVGNGGFSLRSKKLLELAAKVGKLGSSYHPEDVWYSETLRPIAEKHGMSWATEETAQRFSKEGDIRGVVWNDEFGFHGITYTSIKKWLSMNPEHEELLNYPLDDYATLMTKYPQHNGAIKTLHFGPTSMKGYSELADGLKKYEARAMSFQHEGIQAGTKVVCKRSGVEFKKVPIPAFELTIKSMESFDSLSNLRKKYPRLRVTLHAHELPWCKRLFRKVLGDSVYPSAQYNIYWFSENR